MTEFRPDMKGGTKQKWLRENHELVMSFWRQYGDIATIHQFHLKYDTLQNILLRDSEYKSRYHENEALRQKDRAEIMAQMAQAGVAELRGEVRELKESYSRFVPAVAGEISDKFLAPLLRLALKLPVELDEKPKEDPLSVSNLLGESRKDEAGEC